MVFLISVILSSEISSMISSSEKYNIFSSVNLIVFFKDLKFEIKIGKTKNGKTKKI